MEGKFGSCVEAKLFGDSVWEEWRRLCSLKGRKDVFWGVLEGNSEPGEFDEERQRETEEALQACWGRKDNLNALCSRDRD